DGVHHAALPSSSARTRGAGSAWDTPGSSLISGSTRSNRSRADDALASAMASYGPERSSAVTIPRIARSVVATGSLSDRFWINTYAVIEPPFLPRAAALLDAAAIQPNCHRREDEEDPRHPRQRLPEIGPRRSAEHERPHGRRRHRHRL